MSRDCEGSGQLLGGFPFVKAGNSCHHPRKTVLEWFHEQSKLPKK